MQKMLSGGNPVKHGDFNLTRCSQVIVRSMTIGKPGIIANDLCSVEKGDNPINVLPAQVDFAVIAFKMSRQSVSQ